MSREETRPDGSTWGPDGKGGVVMLDPPGTDQRHDELNRCSTEALQYATEAVRGEHGEDRTVHVGRILHIVHDERPPLRWAVKSARNQRDRERSADVAALLQAALDALG